MHIKLDEISSNIYLVGTLLSATFDYYSLADYAIKAFIGGIIWMAFKVGADIVSHHIKNNKDKTND